MLNLLDVPAGATVRLKDGREAQVTENMGCGQWLEVRAVDAPADSDPELVHSQEVVEMLAASSD